MNKLRGANFDVTPISCPWNEDEKNLSHKCAVKNISICSCFFELKNADTVLCCYPKKRNLFRSVLLNVGSNVWIFEVVHAIRFILLKLFGKKRVLKSAREFKAAHSEIDLIPNKQVSWKQEPCPWNEAERGTLHKCVCEGQKPCAHFHGIEYIDIMLCDYNAK